MTFCVKNFAKELILAEGSRFKGQKVTEKPYILKYLRKCGILIKLVLFESSYVLLLMYCKKSYILLKSLSCSDQMKMC